MGLNESMFDAVFKVLEPLMLMKRIGRPEDVANLASFMASDDAINITGSLNYTDSGAILSMPDLQPKDLGKMVNKK